MAIGEDGGAAGVDAGFETLPPPTTWRETLRHLGPGIIVTGSIVGSGELIVTTGLGAHAGFILLWLIVIGCFLKVFVQVELGRYTISEGVDMLRTMDSIPGPRKVVSWLLWLWAVMFVSLIFQLAGILDGAAEVISLLGIGGSRSAIAWGVAALSAILLVSGRYRFIERTTTLMVFGFTILTVAAVLALQWTPSALSPADILEGVQFKLPDNFTWAFAAFGITGVGASELIYYPTWCLEKGYARHVGPRDGSLAWESRAKGWLRVMQVDAWVSFVVYTVATAAFYLLGAAVLHGDDPATRRTVSNDEMIFTLSGIYRESFGAPGLWVFLVGAFFVLFSTFFVATASNARLLADGLSVFKVVRYNSSGARLTVVRAACILLPVLNLVILLWLGGKPVTLVFVGAFGQAILLPFLGLVAVHVRHRKTHPALRPGPVWTVFLWLSFLSMSAIGLYKAYDEIARTVAAP